MNLYNLLGSQAHWQVNKSIARNCGIYAAMILADLISKRQYFIENGDLCLDDWFFNTVENIEIDTTLTKHQQNKALKKLEEFGFVNIKYADVPKKRYYLINDKKVLETLTESQWAKNLTTRGQKICPLEVKKFAHNKNKELIINNNSIVASDFEEVWSLYPNKTNKEQARKYYNAKTRTNTRPEIRAAVENYVAKIKKEKTEKQFIMGGRAFFKDERWREYYVEPKKSTDLPNVIGIGNIEPSRAIELWELANEDKNTFAVYVMAEQSGTKR